MTSDREPPVFPGVGGTSPTTPTGSTSSAPLFTSADDHGAGGETVVMQPVNPPRRSRGWLRWAVAGVATLLVFTLVGGALLLSGPRAGTPSVVEFYVPADTAAYIDARVEFPGDQGSRLAELMSHFPGFADPAAFQQKVDEMLDQMLRRADPALQWQRDVEPWFGGQIGLFGRTVTPAEGTPPSMVIAMTVKDRAALEAFLTARLADHEVDTVEHQGHQIRTFTPDPGNERLSLAVTDELVLVGMRLEDIQGALDVKAGAAPSLAEDTFFLQQLGALPADRLATVYYDMGRVIDSAQGQPGMAPEMPGAECFERYQESARVKYVGGVRAEQGHFAVTVRAQAPTGDNMPPLPANKTTTLSAAMPQDALAYAEFRQVGANARVLIGQLLECMGTGEEMPFDPDMIEEFLGVAPQDYLDFVDDVAVAMTFTNNQPGGGLIATVDDEAVARQRVDRLLSSLRAFLAFGSDGAVSIEDVEMNGVPVTVFTFEELRGMPPVSFAVGLSGGRLFMGLNDFVETAMTRQQPDSLAANERFSAGVAEGGAENAGVMWLDIVGVRQALESAMPQEERTRYDTEVKPFLEPMNSVTVVNTTANGIIVSNIFLHVE